MVISYPLVPNKRGNLKKLGEEGGRVRGLENIAKCINLYSPNVIFLCPLKTSENVTLGEYGLSGVVGINGGVTFLSNSPSSFLSAKEYFSCCQTNSLLRWLAIASIIFSNHYALFHNVYYLKCSFLESNTQTFTVIDEVSR